MRTKVSRSVLVAGLTLVSTSIFTISARSQDGDRDDTMWARATRAVRDCFVSEHHEHNLNTPVNLIGAISPPNAVFAGFDIGFVDPRTEMYYVAESGPNSTTTPPTPSPGIGAVDVLDAENDLVVGRITGFYGRFHPGCPGPEGNGPNGLLVTPDNRLVVGDISPTGNPGTGLVKVFDMNLAVPPYGALAPIATIPTGATCRADEMGYDPRHHIVLVGNPADTPPSATFISLDTYSSLGKISFTGATGAEQPLWDAQLHEGRFLMTVPGMGVVVINPVTRTIDTTYALTNCNSSGLALGPFQNLLVGCSAPGPLQIINALNGHLITLIPEIPSADEVWYNPGDGRFYAPSGASQKLGVIDAETNTFLQNVTGRTGMRSVAAFPENNHVFVIWPPPALQGIPDALKDPCNTMFNIPPKTGCIAVYTHESEAAENRDQDRH